MAMASNVGLVSGLPVGDIIAQLLSLRQRPILNLQSRISDYQSQQSAFIDINNALLNLLSAASAVSTPDAFRQRAATTSDSDALSVTSSSSAMPGSYQVDVLQLATSHRLGAQGFADSDTTAVAAASGSFSFKVGNSGTTTTISVGTSTTLSDLRDAINASDSGVRASIINDGSSTNPHRLVLTSSESGMANEIIITQNDTTLDFANNVIEAATASTSNSYAGTVTSSGTYTGTESNRYVIEVSTGGALETATFRVSTDGGVTFGPADEFTASATPVDIGNGVLVDFSAGTFAVGDRFEIDTFAPEIDNAQDAVIKIDGVTLTRDSNTVSSAIEGVTLTLMQTTSSSATVTVNTDVDTVRGRINTFVAQYNEVMTQIAGRTAFDEETGVRGVLLGDSTVRNVQNTLARLVTSTMPGLENSGFSSLASIGITIDSDRFLVVDSAKLDDALANNLADVEKMFATVGQATSSKLEFIKAGAETEPGTYAIIITQAAEQAQITSNQDITGPLSNAEVLNFTVDGESKMLTVAAGSTLDQAIESINEQLDLHGLAIQAERDGDKLRLFTTGHGSNEEIKVRSNQSGASGTQLGIGTTDRTDSGLDVVGSIGGHTATGEGQVLTASFGAAAVGLEVRVTATTTGFVGNLTVSTGVGIQLETTLESLTDAETGMLQIRQEGLGDSIDDLNDQIEEMQERIVIEEQRLRSQFAGLETLLAQFSATSSFLANSLSQLSALSASFSSRR